MNNHIKNFTRLWSGAVLDRFYWEAFQASQDLITWLPHFHSPVKFFKLSFLKSIVQYDGLPHFSTSFDTKRCLLGKLFGSAVYSGGRELQELVHGDSLILREVAEGCDRHILQNSLNTAVQNVLNCLGEFLQITHNLVIGLNVCKTNKHFKLLSAMIKRSMKNSTSLQSCQYLTLNIIKLQISQYSRNSYHCIQKKINHILVHVRFGFRFFFLNSDIFTKIHTNKQKNQMKTKTFFLKSYELHRTQSP